ncbi:hypothetical protein DFH08DRAFT_964698 [Mycena albidolilacea]|uniref:DUF6534 domain-containing protein n=1 Tax=Mycena albidolilacea TaxID=1033008 RepID=A0AAD7EMW3_9AGAR|nr:hypothetical protein DFH08DRAFT_964698 [Mycena albidolilacea]
MTSSFPPGFEIVQLSGPELITYLAEWSLFSTLTVQLLSFIVQSFYALRLYLLCKSWIVPALIVIFSLAISACGFTTVAFVLEAGDVSLLGTKRISIIGGIWLSGSALIDILIATSMTYYASSSLSAPFSSLISNAAARSLTALVALATLILFFVFPNKSYYTTPANVMPFIYANTMLVVLNSRFQIVGGRSTPPTSLNFASWPVLSLGDTTTMSGATSTQTQTRTREVISNREMDSSMEMKVVQAHGGSEDLAVYAV